MIYERMKYGMEQRAWVKYADEDLPTLRERAAGLQETARNMYANWMEMPPEMRETYGKIVLRTMHDVNSEAVRALSQVLYVEGMRRANLPEGET